MTDRPKGEGLDPRHWGVGRRLAAMIVLALLPLGLMAMQQTAGLARETDRNRELAAMGATVQAAAPQIRMINDAQATAEALASMVGPLIADTAACVGLMDRVQAAEPALTLVAYIPLSGRMTCASGGRTFDFAGRPLFERMAGRDGPGIITNPAGPVSETAVVGVSHPVTDAAGTRIGIVSLSLRHEALVHSEDPPSGGPARIERPVALMTFDGDGNLLTSSVGLDESATLLPGQRALADLAQAGTSVFRASDVGGIPRVFVAVPIAEGLFLLGVWRRTGDQSLVDPAIAPYLLPGLMWLAALAVAVFAAEHLVTRHMRLISTAMASFARGDRGRHVLHLSNPPAEIADLADAYRTMTATILRDEAELENLLRQKEMLLREVHHRTGNSLQIIASVLRMHLREQPDETVRPLLEDLHGRVMSLATVHLGLYRIAGNEEVAVHDLMAEVIEKVSATNERFAGKAAVRADLQPLVLSTGQAVPLALLLSEILAVFPSADAGADDLAVHVSLDRCDEGQARMRITGPAAALPVLLGESPDAPSKIATRVIRAFVTQLGGEMAISAQDGASVAAEVSFPVR